ncbi:MAG: hypothetical protein A3G41_03235 [Elusimicrobia bacterium RIFCSPLOWO2_12_FULL_59_9]|nr:MAG: hypothetical protein A3G41_03235 [Elusimicrobia bacterium RIFCSPLOWO2_12_FULL_59_9]
MANILVIDDDTSNRDILRARLERAGHRVAEAGNGEEGIEIARNLSPDLIILDVMMPKLDGWQACRRLKSDSKTKTIPVVLLTARSQHIEELRGWESGADEYMTKPCDHRRLMDLVARFVDKSSAP